jgi:hypothetical protein
MSFGALQACYTRWLHIDLSCTVPLPKTNKQTELVLRNYPSYLYTVLTFVFVIE